MPTAPSTLAVATCLLIARTRTAFTLANAIASSSTKLVQRFARKKHLQVGSKNSVVKYVNNYLDNCPPLDDCFSYCSYGYEVDEETGCLKCECRGTSNSVILTYDINVRYRAYELREHSLRRTYLRRSGAHDYSDRFVLPHLPSCLRQVRALQSHW